MSLFQKIIIVCGIAVVVLGTIYFYSDKSIPSLTDTKPTSCTEEAKLCPDGSAVGRTGPDCTFAECPSVVETPAATSSMPDQEEHSAPIPTQWSTYTSVEWKYSFEYPSNYTLEEELEGFKVVITPPEGFDGPETWFSVIVIQYPDLEGEEMLSKRLFHRANLPDGELAWLKPEMAFDYENYFIDSEEIMFGKDMDLEALKVRETSLVEERGEHRSIVYVLRDPVIYRFTHNLAAEETHSAILERMNDSFYTFE